MLEDLQETASSSGLLPVDDDLSLDFNREENMEVFNTVHSDRIINRPGVAGAVLQTPLLLINLLTQSFFVEISSEHLQSQTVRARELTF